MAQLFNVREFLIDYTIVQREEAEAKRIRLEWITKERDRIHGELRKYETELTELSNQLPDPIKPRVLAPAIARTRQREQIAFNNFASNNDPAMTGAIRSGSAINALLRVLGPIAHCRKLRASANPETAIFPSLNPDRKITGAEASHFRLTSGSATNTNVVHRVNQLPLDLNWPTILQEKWPVECRDIGKLRDEYVRLLNSAAAADTRKRAERAEVLDSSLELLQAMVVREKNKIPNSPGMDPAKKIKIHGYLKEALNYLTTVRASAEEFKQAPSQFMIHEFASGTVEDFLDFCYVRGMFFKRCATG